MHSSAIMHICQQQQHAHQRQALLPSILPARAIICLRSIPNYILFPATLLP